MTEASGLEGSSQCLLAKPASPDLFCCVVFSPQTGTVGVTSWLPPLLLAPPGCNLLLNSIHLRLPLSCLLQKVFSDRKFIRHFFVPNLYQGFP